MGTVVARFGGTVTEFGGDAVVALFGAPTAHEDDTYRAVRSGLEIVREIHQSAASQEQPLDVRVGIHTGWSSSATLTLEASFNACMLADSLSQIGRFDEAIAAVREPPTSLR